MNYLMKSLPLIVAFFCGTALAAQDASPLPPNTNIRPAKKVRGLTATQDAPPALRTQPAVSPGQISGFAGPQDRVGGLGGVPSGTAMFPRNSQGSTTVFGGTMSVNPFGNSRMSKKERELNRKIREYVEAVKGAADSQSEANATRDLRATLEGLFDERMKRREEEIAQLKKRLEDLKNKNEARKQKKDEIVDLKLKSMVNEAKGFGF